jgi:hypothetical protein
MQEKSINEMLGCAADRIIEVIAKHHDFALPVDINSGEGRRLLTFVELCDKPSKYQELSDMDEKIFYTARCEIRINGSVHNTCNLLSHPRHHTLMGTDFGSKCGGCSSISTSYFPNRRI